MVFSTRKLLAICLPLALCAHALLPDGRAHANMPRRPTVPKVTADGGPVTDVSGAALPPLNTTYIFDQLVDHTNPSLGTFKQRFWHTWEWYEEGMRCMLWDGRSFCRCKCDSRQQAVLSSCSRRESQMQKVSHMPRFSWICIDVLFTERHHQSTPGTLRTEQSMARSPSKKKVLRSCWNTVSSAIPIRLAISA